MAHQYENPPLVEAVCEFHFEFKSQWDWTIPGLLYGQVKRLYPKRREQRGIAIRLDARADGVNVAQEGADIAKLLFFSNDERSLVQVTPGLLAINRLAPYLGWKRFRTEVIKVLGEFYKVAEPLRITQIGVRYINRIPVPEVDHLEQFFNLYPTLPTNRRLKGFLSRNELDYPEDPGTLVIIMASDVQSSSPTVILDLDYTAIGSFALDNQAEAVMDRAHLQVEEMFESCLTDAARNGFREVKNGK